MEVKEREGRERVRGRGREERERERERETERMFTAKLSMRRDYTITKVQTIASPSGL